MFDLDHYLQVLMLNCRSAFGKRLLYMGLQGSYLRGEANENSDIDVMVILDRFSVQDMDTYREILKGIGFYEKSCGFICGKEEMKRWNPLEVCQLRHTTKDLLGTLTDFLPSAGREDEINYVRLSLGNLYHELCHRYIHADREKNAVRFRGTCKSVFYLIQNLHFLESGRFILRKKELKDAAAKEDRLILDMADLPDGYDFGQAFSELFAWCQKAFARIDDLGKRTAIVPVDAENILQAAFIHSTAWKESHRAFCTPDFIEMHTPERQQEYLQNKMNDGTKVYLLVDEKPAGIVSVTGSLIEDLYVLPDLQNRGYGTELLQFAIKQCKEPPVLWILENNTGARRLYCRMGFQETGRRNAITDCLDEIELRQSMEKENGRNG